MSTVYQIHGILDRLHYTWNWKDRNSAVSVAIRTPMRLPNLKMFFKVLHASFDLWKVYLKCNPIAYGILLKKTTTKRENGSKALSVNCDFERMCCALYNIFIPTLECFAWFWKISVLDKKLRILDVNFTWNKKQVNIFHVLIFYIRLLSK